MDPRRLIRRTLFRLVAAAGCDSRSGPEKERDSLIEERAYLTAHQNNLNIAALNILKGRGFQDVSPAESAQLAVLFQQRAAADARAKIVDSQLEQVQAQIQGNQGGAFVGYQ